MSRRPGPPAREHPFFRNMAKRRTRPEPAASATKRPAPESLPNPTAGGFRRTAAHYWRYQRRAARAAGNRYPSFAQVPGPWRVARLGAFAQARRTGEPWDITLRGAWFEWLFTRPKVLLTRSGSARLAVELFSVVVVLGTLWGFWVERERRQEERELLAEERDHRRSDRINAAWTLISAAKTDRTGNLGLVDAIATLRGEGIKDLTGVTLPEAHLKGVQLSGATMDVAMLRKSNLEQADFSDASLWQADLSGANLQDAHLAGAYLVGADLSAAWLWEADLTGADLRHGDLSGATLKDANLSRTNLKDADLSRAYVRGANLTGASLWEADLSGARLMDANLSDAYLKGANLSDTDLSSTDLSGAVLQDADLSGSRLLGADLMGADLSTAQLSFSHLRLVAWIELPDGDRVWSLLLAELGGADLAGADLRGTPFGIDAPGPDVLAAP